MIGFGAVCEHKGDKKDVVKDFTPFTLFNLALWFKLYFSFRES